RRFLAAPNTQRTAFRTLDAYLVGCKDRVKAGYRSRSRVAQAVTDARLGDEPARASRIPLELAAQGGDVDAQRRALIDDVGSPDRAEGLVVGEHAPRRAGQEGQQLELDRRQVHDLAVDRDLVARLVDADRTDRDHVRRARPRTAQHDPDPREQ